MSDSWQGRRPGLRWRAPPAGGRADRQARGAESSSLAVTGGDFQVGDLGPTKLGDRVVNGTASDGEVRLEQGEFATAALTKETVPLPRLIAYLPEPSAGPAFAAGFALLTRLARGRSRARLAG